MSGKHDRAAELRAIADGRLLLNVRNGVTVSRSMLAMIADELDAERAAHAETKRELDDIKDEWEAEYETRRQYQTRLRGTETRLAELEKALDGLLEPFEGDDCRYDHHGYCQAHFLQEGDECCVKIARRVREGEKVDG